MTLVDRMLVATAALAGMPLVTADRTILDYTIAQEGFPSAMRDRGSGEDDRSNAALAAYERARLHEQLGQSAQAVRGPTRTSSPAGQSADVEFQPKVQQASAAIQRLASVIRE